MDNSRRPRVNHDFLNSGSRATNKTTNASRGENMVNPRGDGLIIVNPAKAYIYQGFLQRVNQGYPCFGINGLEITLHGKTRNKVNLVNPLNPDTALCGLTRRLQPQTLGKEQKS